VVLDLREALEDKITIGGSITIIPIAIAYFSQDVVVVLCYLGIVTPLWYIYFKLKQNTEIFRRWLKL